jgi:enediyne biosynthesis protein E4
MLQTQSARQHLGILLLLLSAWLIFVPSGCSRRSPSPISKENSPAPAAPDFFDDATATSGVAADYRNGEESGLFAILESLGGGVAAFDFNGDGWLDLFVPGGGSLSETSIEGRPGKLFQNLGGWEFRDVTHAVMPDQALFYTHGAAAADYDCDGWPDLLVTGWGRVALYHNEPLDPANPSAGRRFVERAEEAGLTGVAWSTSAAWADFDGDGFPDLYVCQYVDWSLENNPRCQGYSAGIDRDVCPPGQFNGLPDLLFRNNRDGTFSEVGMEGGLRVDRGADDGKPLNLGKGLGVIAADLNDDKRPDIYVANDTVDNFLYWNRGAFDFEESALLSGVARDDRGLANGSMGIAVGDYNGSGRASLFVTNYENEMHALYRNLGREQFLHSTSVSQIAALGQKYVAFGAWFLDLDHQGRQDLIVANGHVIRHPVVSGLRQAPVLLRNQGEGKFELATERGGSYFQQTHIARGMAVGDFDNDGRLDLVISHVNEPVAVLRNVAPTPGRHWIGLQLRGRNHRDLVGTKVSVEAGDQRWTRFVAGGGSYLSSHDERLVIGLGSAGQIDRLTVAWSHGTVEQWSGKELEVDGYWRVSEEGDPPVRAAAVEALSPR